MSKSAKVTASFLFNNFNPMVITLEAILDLLIFQLSGIELCADTKRIISILKPEELSSLKTEHHGKVVVRDEKEFLRVDLKEYIAIKEEKLSDETRAILMELNNEGIVFFVDKVIELISIDPQSPYHSYYFASDSGEYIDGIIKYEDKLYMVPDYKKISMSAKQRLRGYNGIY